MATLILVAVVFLVVQKDGFNWIGLGNKIFETKGQFGLLWDGTKWLMGGIGISNNLAYSSSGTMA